jgi:hypothetical protein
VNPSIVTAQMESAIVYGLTAALWGEITIENGRAKQSNFHDYRMLRLAEMPVVEVHIVPSSDAQGGVGSPARRRSRPRCVTLYSRSPASGSGNCRSESSSRRSAPRAARLAWHHGGSLVAIS